MSYTVSIFKKEVKEKYPSNFDFLEDEGSIAPFSAEQLFKLKERLLLYGYKIEKEKNLTIAFLFKEDHGISATLYKNQLAFSSGFSVDAVAEISLTASEFTDSGEFAKLDLQNGGWEEI